MFRLLKHTARKTTRRLHAPQFCSISTRTTKSANNFNAIITSPCIQRTKTSFSAAVYFPQLRSISTTTTKITPKPSTLNQNDYWYYTNNHFSQLRSLGAAIGIGVAIVGIGAATYIQMEYDFINLFYLNLDDDKKEWDRLVKEGKPEEAEPFARQLLSRWIETSGVDHRITLTIMNNLGLLLQDQGKLKEAEPLFRRALEGFEKTLGPDHSNTLTSVNNLAFLFYDQGKLNEAESLFRRAVEGSERTLGPDHKTTLL